MEGVPRLYMIGLPAKHCVDDRKPDFATTINYHIQKSYNRDPSLYSSDIDTLHKIRQSAIAVIPSVSTVNQITVLKCYYAHLVRLTNKFPKLLEMQVSNDIELKVSGQTSLIFTWKRALGGKIIKQRQMKNTDIADILAVDTGNIGYEMRCILYNIGAAHSRLAAAQDRSPPLMSPSTPTTVETESSSNTALKIACTHLQCAAWAFQQLLGDSKSNSEHPKWHHQQKPLVTNRAVLEFAYNVTLAQAQECILEKSMMDGRKSLIIAKVSAMICEYFAEAVNAVHRVECESFCVSAKRLEKWRLYSEFKCRYYGAITALFQGQHVQDQLQQMGTRVSYYRRAVNLLGRAGQISESNSKELTTKDYDSADDDYYYYLDSKDRGPGIGLSATTKELEMRRDTLSFAMDVAAAKWRAAKSENELIYHEHVVPVLSDDDDSDCLGQNLSSKTDTQRPQLNRVKGASLVKPIGFSCDDPELLAITVIANNKGSSFTTTSTTTTTTSTLFKDLVHEVTRQRAATYRFEKNKMEVKLRSMCQVADDQLTTFMDTLHLECLEMFKEPSSEFSYDGNEKNNVAELPQKLVNYCATYQAMLQQQQENGGTLSSHEKEDQLYIDVGRLSSAMQAVDSMLDEIDTLLKAEEQGNSEYQRTVGQPFDYSTVRMRELRREASRYREAHYGPARESWLTLSQAVKDRRRRELELLALPLSELAARLPPARPLRSAIAAEVAAIGIMDSSSSYEVHLARSLKSSDQDDVSEPEESNSGRLRQLQQESLERLNRLNMVVDKIREVRVQRQEILLHLQEKMDIEDKNAVESGKDDADVLGESRASEEDISAVVKKKLDDLYGNLVNMIEKNLAAQSNVLDAVRTAYAQTAPERRAYANALQRRENLVSSILEAFESYMVINGETPLKSSNETITVLSNVQPPDVVLAERCAKGLEFYQRMITNVSKLLQRVKGACQVQNEQRDQIMKLHHRQWVASSDDDQSTTVDLDHHLKDDMASLIESLGGNSDSNKPYIPLKNHWEQNNQQNDVRRLSPLGSEGQQHIYQYKYHDNSIIPPNFTNKMSTGNDYHGYYSDDGPPDSDIDDDLHLMSNTQQVPSVETYPAAVNSIALDSSLTSPLLPSSSMLFNYNNSQSPTVQTSSISPIISSSSFQTSNAETSNNPFKTTAMINALCLTNNNNPSKNNVSTYISNKCISRNSINDDENTGGFTNAKAAVAVLQRPLPSPYISGSVAIGRGIGNINNTGIGYGTVATSGAYRPDLPITQTQLQPQQQQQQLQQQKQQQFYSQQFRQQNSTATTVNVGSTTGLGTTGIFQQQQHGLVPGGQQLSLTGNVNCGLPLSSTLISTTTMNNGCNISATVQSPSSHNIPTRPEFFPRLTSLHQQPQQLQMLYQQQQHPSQIYQQQSHLYQQHSIQLQQLPKVFEQQQIQQQPQLYYPKPEIYQQPQQQQEITNQLTTTSSSNSPGNFYYPLQKLQSTTTLTSVAVTSTNTDGSSYYQQLQQYYSPNTVTATTEVPLNTTATLNNFYYQQPSQLPVSVMTYDQQQQYYQQQQQLSNVYGGLSTIPSTTATTPVVNLLDDDLLLSGPPPIQPEKIRNIDVTTTSS